MVDRLEALSVARRCRDEVVPLPNADEEAVRRLIRESLFHDRPWRSAGCFDDGGLAVVLVAPKSRVGPEHLADDRLRRGSRVTSRCGKRDSGGREQKYD